MTTEDEEKGNLQRTRRSLSFGKIKTTRKKGAEAELAEYRTGDLFAGCL